MICSSLNLLRFILVQRLRHGPYAKTVTSQGSTSVVPLSIAQFEDVPDRCISRMIRLAYLSPAVLERLVLERCSPAMSIKDLVAAADLPWKELETAVFG
jgi:hypothetical protein